MKTILDAIRETFDIDLTKECRDGYEINFLHNYCGRDIVDVEVIDYESGEKVTVYCYDQKTHCFPWSYDDYEIA